MNSSCKNLDVFDFKEDELSECPSSKLFSKFKNPNAIDKYSFLEEVADGTNFQSKEIDNLPCVDVDAMDNVHSCDNAVSHIPIGLEGEDPAPNKMSGLDDFLLFNSTNHEQQAQFIPDKLKPGSFSAQLEPRASNPGEVSLGISQLKFSLQESPSSDESVDVISDADESICESSPSTSDVSGDDYPLDGPLSDNFLGGWEMGDRNAVVVCPDYIVYRGRFCTEFVLIFSSNCIEVKGSTTYRNDTTFNFQWGIDDVVDIESQWSQSLQIAKVKLCLISKDAMQADDAQGTSGIEELKFAVHDSNWYEKREQITSLDVRYKALWKVEFDCIGGDGVALPGQNGIHIPKKRYFPKFDEPFEEVVYPKGDADAVSISKRDVDLLQPDTFVNDTIIDFYIKYLKNEMQPEERQRFHFFNSFFFRKLIDLDKDPSSAFEGRAAFQRVRKWTRKVNLFEKDYVFIPVNFNYHWSLIIICHPGEISKFQDVDMEKSLKVPCILHMDSIKGTHTGLKDLVQSYLWEEWKERQKEASEDFSSKFFNLRFVPLELPQQQNSFDCGLFLLHYVERFLGDAPLNFSPFKITKFSNFLNMDWFPPAEPSLKRVHIQRLICEILERENPPAACRGEPCASDYPESKNEIEAGVDFTSERHIHLKSCHGNLSSSQASQGIELTLLPSSSFKSSQFTSDSGSVLREFLEAGATASALAFLNGQYPTFDRTTSFSEFKVAMSSIEEDVEPGEQFVYSPSNRTGFRELNGITPEGCVFTYSSRDFGAETSWNLGISVHQAGHEDIDASPATSICASDDSLEVKINQNNIDQEDEDLSTERIAQPRSPSTENVECLTENFASISSDMVENSQYSDHDADGNDDDLISCPYDLPGLSNQENGNGACLIGDSSVSESDEQKVLERTGNDSVPESDEQQAGKRIGDDSELGLDELQPVKRLKLTLPLEEEERRLTKSLSEDQQL
ncbi:hypothetical protein ACSBR2_000799 [Camellia fascicularis]